MSCMFPQDFAFALTFFFQFYNRPSIQLKFDKDLAHRIFSIEIVSDDNIRKFDASARANGIDRTIEPIKVRILMMQHSVS